MSSSSIGTITPATIAMVMAFADEGKPAPPALPPAWAQAASRTSKRVYFHCSWTRMGVWTPPTAWTRAEAQATLAARGAKDGPAPPPPPLQAALDLLACALVELSVPYAGKFRVADFGCGTSAAALVQARSLGASHCVGLDLSEAAVRAMRTKHVDDASVISWHQANVCLPHSLPQFCVDGTYHLVLALRVLNLVWHDDDSGRAMLATMASLLRPCDGRAVILHWDDSELQAQLALETSDVFTLLGKSSAFLGLWWAGGGGGANAVGCANAPSKAWRQRWCGYRVSLGKLCAVAAAAGLEVVSTWNVGTLLPLILSGKTPCIETNKQHVARFDQTELTSRDWSLLRGLRVTTFKRAALSK